MFCGGVSKFSKSPILTSKKSAMGIPNLAPYNDRRSGLHQIYWKTKARAAMEFHPRTKWNFGIKNNWTILFPKIHQYESQNVVIPDSQNPSAKITILCTKWTKIKKTEIFAHFFVFLLKNTPKCKIKIFSPGGGWLHNYCKFIISPTGFGRQNLPGKV